METPQKRPVPEERNQTIRQELISILMDGMYSAGSLSKIVGKSTKDIYDHLDQLKRSGILIVDPAKCKKCNFVFKTRSKVKKPGKCPQCRSTYIEAPLFSVKAKK